MPGILREPDIPGQAGKGWKVKVQPPQDETTLSAYLVSVYGAHPIWNWWLISFIHLRDIPGMPAAKKDYPEATYELLILTINPKSCPPDPDNPNYEYLVPVDVQIQFHGLEDEDVKELCKQAVTAIVDGCISPDQDYRFAWRELIKHKVQELNKED
jgi:hypothetical protein